MQSIFKEVNIVLVANNVLDFDSFNRGQIKAALKDTYDESPRYIEIPEQAAVFDYLTNPEFPVQLSLQANKIIFIQSGNAGFDPGEEENLTNFANRFKAILELDTFSSVVSDIKAIGFNSLVSIISEDAEEAFSTVMSSKFSDVLTEEGDFHAGGLQLVRINGNKRIEVNLNPVVPEMGEAFTHSYNLRVNQHIQPATTNWLNDLATDIQTFKSKVEQIITTLDT